ncbi:MAG: hypothetical protein AAGC83_07085 [Pseudomonadota bacterium]
MVKRQTPPTSQTPSLLAALSLATFPLVREKEQVSMIRTASLSHAQQLVIWSARSWIDGYTNGESVRDVLYEAYELSGIPEAAHDVNDLFVLFVTGSKHTVAFGSPRCPAVHLIEAYLNNCLHAFQTQDDGRASKILGELLIPQRAVQAAVPARRWAEALTKAGRSLDLIPIHRVFDKPEPAEDTLESFHDRVASQDPSKPSFSDFPLRAPGVTLH